MEEGREGGQRGIFVTGHSCDRSEWPVLIASGSVGSVINEK